MPSGTPRRNDLWSLLDASWAAEEGGLDAFLHRVLERSAAHFGATGASLFLLDEDTGEFRLATKSGLDARMPDDAVILPGEGFAGKAVRTGRPLLLGPEQGGRRELTSAMVVPLVGPEGDCIGVLNLSRGTGLRTFSANDLRRARAVAGHLALAVSNAMLFRRMDEAVREARALHLRLRTVLDCLGVGMLVIDSDGRVIQHNAQFGIMTGANLVDGRAWNERPTVSRELTETLARAVGVALVGRSERRHCTSATTDRSWVVVGAPMRCGAAIAVEEVTELDRLQRETARTSRLAEIGQMTAAIAHEIRNPLTGIRTAAQLVRTCPEQSDELGRIIEEEAVKLNHLCDDFLEFARPLRLELTPVDLGEVVREVAESCRAEFDSAGVSLAVRKGGLSIIEADRRRVEQVCRNLLLNALQACERGGEVEVLVEEGRLSVVDSGAGIDDETKDKLFTPFFTTKSRGTGLGLSTVRKIVQAHGGHISVHSELGKGTSFELDFGKAA
ncbi:MAG TPA: ATP-binding protein [Fimbriimonadaceae bacterium]|nr:ATP-binding protein [Fimbriimonadaceae bacterium]HRJ96025.1 ATP-binding protein [Fimbriimonadaceae bacterium]